MLIAGSRRFPLLIFCLLTVINAGIFLLKAHFDYKPYAGEKELYAPADGTWRRYLSDFSSRDQEATTRFLDSLLHGKDTSQPAQIRYIGSFLFQQFGTRLGKPALNDQLKTPWDMYQFFSADSSRKLWCGHLAMMFNYFCLARGIETRMIEIMKPGDHHVVNECYLPVYQKWVLVDITYNQLLVKEGQQAPLGLTAFRRMQGRDIQLEVQTANNSGRMLRPDTGYYSNYYNRDYPAFYYRTINPEVVYRGVEKVKRYVLPVSWYRILDADPESNLPFYLKQGVLNAWLLSLLYLLWHLLKRKV